MTGPVRYGRTSLQAVEDRIRRLFSIGGDIGVAWKPDLTLSLDAGSLTAPGTNDFRGRRFTFVQETGTPGINSCQPFQFGDPTSTQIEGYIIDFIRLEHLAAVAAGSRATLVLSDTTTFVFPDINRAQVQWVERPDVQQGPLIRAPGMAVNAAPSNSPPFLTTIQQVIEYRPEGMFLPAGDVLYYRNLLVAQTAGVIITVSGRVF